MSSFNDNDYCFACGSQNPLGLHLTYATQTGPDGVVQLTTQVAPAPHWQGFAGVLHGGLQATIMDDLMSNYLFRIAHVFVATAELTLRYKQPVPLDQELLFVCWPGAHNGRVWTMQAECRLAADPAGVVLTMAEARFVELRQPPQ